MAKALACVQAKQHGRIGRRDAVSSRGNTGYAKDKNQLLQTKRCARRHAKEDWQHIKARLLNRVGMCSNSRSRSELTFLHQWMVLVIVLN